MEYVLKIYRFDKRTKNGLRLTGTYEFNVQDDDAMNRECRALRDLYPTKDYFMEYNPKFKTVKNLMSGEDVVIATDTPRSCDPSSELYWSM
jgi:hypothetical protein